MSVADLTDKGVLEGLGAQCAIDVGARGVLLAVSDGMGGENAGEVASAMVLETMNAYLRDNDPSADPAATLAAAVNDANAKVLAAAEQRELSGMGATLIAFLVSGGSAFTAEIGDSRAYVLRQGNLTQLSKDQTHVGLLVAQGILKPEDAKKSRAKNVILQACGKLPELVVAQRSFPVRRGDRLLLCSDGLTLHVEDREIEEVLVSVASPDEASAKLVAMANERGGKDNVTVLVANVEGAAPPAGPDDTIEGALTVLREFGPGAE
jgi:serine/threonine protein phosphatase PrpC